MFLAAAWIIEQEMKAIDFIVADDVDPKDKLYLQLVAVYSTSPILGGVAMTPYWSLHRSAAAADWAVKDIAYTKSRGGALRGLHNWYPRTLAFARRGGARFVVTKIGARFIPVIGWALFAYDLWNVGKWIGEKTSPV